MRNRLAPLLLLPLLAFTLTACSSGASGGSAGSAGGTPASTPSGASTPAAQTPAKAAAANAPDPCAVVTASDVTSVLGAAATGKSSEAGLYQSCIYGGSSPVLIVLVRAIDKATFEASGAKIAGSAPVTGIGDRAFSGIADGKVGLLVWKSGVEVSLLAPSAADPLNTEKRLAQAAVARL